MNRTRIRSVALAGLLLLPAAPGLAQTTPMANTHAGIQPAVKFDNGQHPEQHQAPPPALPGSQANPPTPTPAGHSTADMPPNDALFDAINRGDEASARDALNRGADIHARNVLGMTPLELSVDLNRNSISFLLLSMRGGDDGGDASPRRPVMAGHAPPPLTAPPPARMADRHARPARRPHAHPSDGQEQTAQEQTAQETPPTRPVPSRTNDGGTPNPQAGFLGFDRR